MTTPNSPSDTWTVAGRTFSSRLIVGTGKYKDYQTNADAARAAGAEIVTVAVRRVNLTDRTQPLLMDFVKPTEFTYLPNTAGCFTGEDAVRTLRLAREAGDWSLVKLEVLSDPKTLYPDMEETLRALKLLVAEGFDVMVYCTDDLVYCRKLEEAGAAAIMPLGAPIGSGLGIQNKVQRHEACGHRRPRGLSGRPYAAPDVRRSVFAAGGADLISPNRWNGLA
jgi:thiazole synthase